MKRKERLLDFSPVAFLALVPSLVVITFGSWFVSAAGYPIDFLAAPFAPDGHAEAAVRLKVLATFTLLSAMGLAGLAYFCINLPSFSRRAKINLGIVYLVLAAAGTLSVVNGQPEEAQRFLGEREVCASFEFLERNASARPAAIGEKEKQGPPRAKSGMPRVAGQPTVSCQARNFHLLRKLSDVQRIMLALVAPALVLGAVSCWPAPGKADAAACKRKGQLLNNYLYLSSAILVSGLLFLSALLRWPGTSLHPSDAAVFNAHVDGLVLYWSLVYSIFIAAYYVPIMSALAAKCSRGKSAAGAAGGGGADGGGVLPSAFPLLKLGSGIFAPAVVGLLGQVIKV